MIVLFFVISLSATSIIAAGASHSPSHKANCNDLMKPVIMAVAARDIKTGVTKQSMLDHLPTVPDGQKPGHLYAILDDVFDHPQLSSSVLAAYPVQLCQDEQTSGLPPDAPLGIWAALEACQRNASDDGAMFDCATAATVRLRAADKFR